MALIAMAVYDTVDNNRTQFTDFTIDCLLKTVAFNKHRLFIIDNNSCEETKELLREYKRKKSFITIITNKDNLGTAEAVNLAWKERFPNEHCLKMDNDVGIYQEGWLDDLEFVLNRFPEIGILGLKRKDLEERPDHEDPHNRSQVHFIEHHNGEKWFFVEEVEHVIGTCQLYNYKLLNKIGYLYQPFIYGFDDVLAAHRCQLAGFINCFLPTIEIDHIDKGGDEFTQWKRDVAGEYIEEVGKIIQEYKTQIRPIYYSPF